MEPNFRIGTGSSIQQMMNPIIFIAMCQSSPLIVALLTEEEGHWHGQLITQRREIVCSSAVNEPS